MDSVCLFVWVYTICPCVCIYMCTFVFKPLAWGVSIPQSPLPGVNVLTTAHVFIQVYLLQQTATRLKYCPVSLISREAMILKKFTFIPDLQLSRSVAQMTVYTELTTENRMF